MNTNGKVYFAKFTDKETGDSFYKFGHTRSYDAMKRFTYEPEQYSKWDIQIMKSVYGPIEQMMGIEETLKALYPKNFWIAEKISGVTEIVKLEDRDVHTIIELMTTLGNAYYKKREREKEGQND